MLLFGLVGLRGFLVFLRKFFSFFEEVFCLIGGLVAIVGLLPFLVKLPVFFFHFWLPKAHVEAPVFGSVLLAGALLKLGGFGSYVLLVFIKLKGPWAFFIIFIVFCMCLVLTQRDIKRMIAYLSVAHIGRLIFMYFSGATWAWPLAKVLILSHAITSPLFFFICKWGVLKD